MYMFLSVHKYAPLGSISIERATVTHSDYWICFRGVCPAFPLTSSFLTTKTIPILPVYKYTSASALHQRLCSHPEPVGKSVSPSSWTLPERHMSPHQIALCLETTCHHRLEVAGRLATLYEDIYEVRNIWAIGTPL